MTRPSGMAARAVQAGLLALAAAVIYLPVARGGWLWDDRVELGPNAALQGWPGLAKIWVQPPGDDYYPLKSTVQWLQWQAWGDRTLGYHLTNLALHVLSGLLLWRLLRRMGLAHGWLAGLVFVVHPLAVESVAWIEELKNVLALPPLLLAACAWVDWSDRRVEGGRRPPGGGTLDPSLRRPEVGGHLGDKLAYGLALFWFLISLLCKTSGVMFPCLLLLEAWWRKGRIGRADLRASAPFFALSLVLGSVGLWFQHHRAIDQANFLPPGLAWRVAGAGVTALFYLAKAAVPVALAPIYPRWALLPFRLIQMLPWLAGAAEAAWLWRRRSVGARAAVFGLGFFFLNLVPVCGLVPLAIMRFTWAMDHLAYLSLAGLAALAAAAFGAGQVRWPGRVGRWAIAGVAGLALVLLVWQSRAYARNFRDEPSLWTHTLKENPQAWLAANNLGGFFLAAGRSEEAMALFHRALRLNPGYAEAHGNLGSALEKRGRWPEAIAEYEAALRSNPGYEAAHYNLGLTLAESGRRDEAIRQFREAIRLEPAELPPRFELARLLVVARDLPGATEQYEAIARLRPDAPEVHLNLGNLYYLAGRFVPAAAQYRRALQLKPGFTAAAENLRYAQQALRDSTGQK